jgi:hypothetical protein
MQPMEEVMALTQVVLRLARNPGYPDGDVAQGYVIHAPLDEKGQLSVEEWRHNRELCKVIRVKPGVERDADGLLTHKGSHWFIHYDEPREGDDEPVYRLGDHSMALGAYLTVHESDGRDLTYRVEQHLPLPKQPEASVERA